jgi:hypothetical protein
MFKRSALCHRLPFGDRANLKLGPSVSGRGRHMRQREFIAIVGGASLFAIADEVIE